MRTTRPPRHPLGSLVGFILGLAIASACNDKPDDPAPTTSTTVLGTTSAGTTTGKTTGTTTETPDTDTNAASTQAQTSGSTGAGVCGGPEHEEFQNALCPQAYPDCTPLPHDLGWETYCEDIGLGLAGAGECSCMRKAVECAVEADVSELFCCCPLEDLDKDP